MNSKAQVIQENTYSSVSDQFKKKTFSVVLRTIIPVNLPRIPAVSKHKDF